ncbi:MAG: hypothetical protein JWM76_4212 [Pseudonocardiales bacterium]|nr:hypothetical protein [Pseudonocardiales bacterium]
MGDGEQLRADFNRSILREVGQAATSRTLPGDLDAHLTQTEHAPERRADQVDRADAAQWDPDGLASQQPCFDLQLGAHHSPACDKPMDKAGDQPEGQNAEIDKRRGAATAGGDSRDDDNRHDHQSPAELHHR